MPVKMQGRKILIACSGGIDSMVLLDLTLNHFEKNSLRKVQLCVCTIDHGQRPDSKLDPKWVASICKKRGVRHYAVKLRLKPHASEQAMRNARYQALAKIAGKNGLIVTAHHQDDELETLLFRLLRGTHPESVKGVSRTVDLTFGKDRVTLIRPLLLFSKKQIQNHASEHGLKWREDTTNQDLRYSRNRIRHELIPLLEAIQPKAGEHLLSFFSDLLSLHRPDPTKKSAAKQTQVLRSLRAKKGVETRKCDFFSLKNSIDHLLGTSSSRTTRAHWSALKKQLEARQLTKTGGGPEKTIQFPGDHSVLFKQNRIFWIKNNRPI